MDTPHQPLGEGRAWVADGGVPLLPQCHAPHPHISSFPAEASPGSWGWGKRTERVHPWEGNPGVNALGHSICLGGRGSEKHEEGDQQEGPPACPAPPILMVPSVTSPRWLLLSASVGTPPPSLYLHFLPSALCSMGSSPLSPWPHGAQPLLSSLGSELPVGAGPTLTHLGITTWGAGWTGGQGGCGGPSSALRPPLPLGFAPACGCGAGRR